MSAELRCTGMWRNGVRRPQLVIGSSAVYFLQIVRKTLQQVLREHIFTVMESYIEHNREIAKLAFRYTLT